MQLDLALVCRLLADHLDEDGIDASAHDRELRIVGGPTLRLRPEGPPDDKSPGTMFWADVDGLRLEPPMSLDLSGWGVTAEDRATDAVHGLLSAVVPPVRWLAKEPWRPPTEETGRVLRTQGEDGLPWTVVVGRPWVIVASTPGTDSVDRLGHELRQAISTAPEVTLEALGSKVAMLSREPRGHWIKIFAAHYPDGTLSCRLDIDNQFSIESRPFAETIAWHDAAVLEIVRELVVLRPDGEPPRPRQASRLRRILGRC